MCFVGFQVLELCDCSLDAGADFKLFSVVAAFSQRVAVLEYETVFFSLLFLFARYFPSVLAAIITFLSLLYFHSEFAKILLSKLDFRELDFKLQKAKVR